MFKAFIYLYLGHLFGDYVLQFSWIAINKPKRNSALLLHITLIYLSQIAFALGQGFFWKGFIGVSCIVALHYLIDTLKIKSKSDGWMGYVTDQLFHIITLIIFAPLLNNIDFYIPFDIAIKLTITIFNAYFLGLLTYFIFSRGTPYKRDWLGYVLRGILPWLWNPLVVTGVTIIGTPLVLKLYKTRTKEVLYSVTGSFLVTIIWEVLG